MSFKCYFWLIFYGKFHLFMGKSCFWSLKCMKIPNYLQWEIVWLGQLPLQFNLYLHTLRFFYHKHFAKVSRRSEITVYKEICHFCVKIKSHNSEVTKVIWLLFELGRVIMPINIFPRFHEDRTTTVWVREQT